MRNVILHILCEGQTEERFVKDVLAPYLLQYHIFAKPVLLITSKKKNAKGGMLSYEQAKRDLRIMMKGQRNNEFECHVFTTMFDYYALPDDFPGHNASNCKLEEARSRIAKIEEEFKNDIGSDAFVPYIQLHEFEALLFVDIELLKEEYPKSDSEISKLKKETAGVEPEMINNLPATAPSKRIIKALSKHYNYNKVKSGAKVTYQIGMEKLLNECKHFGEWVESIKSLST